MVDEKKRALNYRQAIFADDKQDDLEAVVRGILKKASSVAGRRTAHEDGPTTEIRHAKTNSKHGVYIHIAWYTPAEKTSVVPIAKPEDEERDLETRGAPRGTEYMDGDACVLIRRNDVLLTAHNFGDGRFEAFISELGHKLDPDKLGVSFGLTKKIKRTMLEKLLRDGVKRVMLDVAEFGQEIEHMERKTVSQNLRDGVLDLLNAYFGRDPGMEDLSDAENMTARLTIIYDRRKKGKIEADDFATLGRALVEEGAAGYTIVTTSGETITERQMVVRGSAMIEAHGKSVQYTAAWAALYGFYESLCGKGIIKE